jgi:hypothetical protein
MYIYKWKVVLVESYISITRPPTGLVAAAAVVCVWYRFGLALFKHLHWLGHNTRRTCHAATPSVVLLSHTGAMRVQFELAWLLQSGGGQNDYWISLSCSNNSKASCWLSVAAAVQSAALLQKNIPWPNSQEQLWESFSPGIATLTGSTTILLVVGLPEWWCFTPRA